MEPIFNLKEGGGRGGGGLSTSAWGREFVGMDLNHPTPENFEIYSSYVPHTQNTNVVLAKSEGG